jgi:hypothetical protein
MKNKNKAISTVVFLSVFIWLISCGKQKEEWKGTIKEVDGVTVVKNPEFPIKGTILLEVEKILEINPYDNPDIGIRYFYSAKDKDGEVILSDSNRAEAHRFSSKGEYIGSLIREGQGPGEFQPFHSLRIFFINNQILATSIKKMAKFNKNGEFLEEQRLDESPDFFVDESKYITLKSQWREDGQLRRVTLVNLAIKEDIVFFEAVREWLIRKGDSAFNDPWATPSICYAYCSFSDKVFTAINEEYKIYVYDLEGKVIQIIERPYKYVKVNLEDKKKLLPWAAKEESWKWAFSAYPDTLSAIKDLAILPKGYLAVYRIVGPKKFEIDVYGADGKLVYILKLPEGITLERAKFYDFGFTTQMTRDEFPVYCEFKIKNVPEIFNN